MLRTEEAKAEVRAGFARLRALMAMRVTSERIPLLDSLYTVMRPLPIMNDLVMQALDSHPEARNAFYKVERARHTISSERANVIPGDVQLGFATDVLGDVKSLGPALNIGVPLFDTNQAQIARAHFLFDQAEKELLKAHTKVTRDVLESYYKLEGFVAQVETYIGPIKPAFERAIEYIMTHKEDEAKMPFSDLLNVLQELDGFFDVKIRYFETLRKTLDEYADLEFAAGRDVPFTVLTAPNNTTPTHSSPEAHMFHLFELALSALSAASAQ